MLSPLIGMRGASSEPSSDDPVVTPENPPDALPPMAAELGLSKPEYDTLVKAMLPVVWKVGCPVHVQPLEVVHDAFVVAAAKRISKPQSSGDWKRFVGLMRKLAEFAALTNRKSKHQRLLGQGHSEDEVATLILAEGHAEAVDAGIDLQNALTVLKPADQEILLAIFKEGKTISELAEEKGLARSTLDSRVQRALALLRTALLSIIPAIVLLFPKKARAQVVRLVQQVSRVVPHAMHAACAMTVMVACGMMVPSASAATTVSQGRYAASVSSPPPVATIAATMMPVAPLVVTEVEPVKQIGIDELVKQWSAPGMNSFKIARCFQTSLVPFAFLFAPAVTQVGCAGAEQHTSPPPEPEEPADFGGADPYDRMCAFERRRGDTCPSKVDWCASMGKRPAPAPIGCQ